MHSSEQNLNLILAKLEIIEAYLLESNKLELHDYVSEQEAKKLFKRGTTWFWELRRSGLPYSKLGGQVYYKTSDLKSLLEHGTSSLL